MMSLPSVMEATGYGDLFARIVIASLHVVVYCFDCSHVHGLHYRDSPAVAIDWLAAQV
jgi:hypothetical protein